MPGRQGNDPQRRGQRGCARQHKAGRAGVWSLFLDSVLDAAEFLQGGFQVLDDLGGEEKAGAIRSLVDGLRAVGAVLAGLPDMAPVGMPQEGDEEAPS